MKETGSILDAGAVPASSTRSTLLVKLSRPGEHGSNPGSGVKDPGQAYRVLHDGADIVSTE